MRPLLPLLMFTALAGADEPKLVDAPKPPDGFPRFKVQEIDTGLKIGYAVITADINGDKKPDIVVVDQHKVVWYENPTWKKRVILDGKTTPDNVCVAAVDIDGDGLPELVLGAAWKPFDTKTPGTLQWLKRGKTLDDEWTMHPIPCDEPTVHRVKVADLDGSHKPQIVVAPLMGKDATKEKNWLDGRPVRILAYQIPKEPEKAENWKAEVISKDLHVVHNFCTLPAKLGDVLIFACYEGVRVYFQNSLKDRTWAVGEGDQSNPNSNRGSSEITDGWRKDGPGAPWHDRYAAVEPWHGNSIVVYTEKFGEKKNIYTRTVIDSHLRWGHAVKFADLNGDGNDLLVAGVRDDPDAKQGDKFTEKRGIRVYRDTDGKGTKWDRFILEDGGVAVEDLTVADLNGDGKPDIVAVGRATGNARIYWNQGK